MFQTPSLKNEDQKKSRIRKLSAENKNKLYSIIFENNRRLYQCNICKRSHKWRKRAEIHVEKFHKNKKSATKK